MLDLYPLQNHEAIKRNDRRGDGTSVHGRCRLCGANIRNPNTAVYVREHCGGGVIVTEEEAGSLPENEDLGGQPIGPECYRKHKETLLPYVSR